MRQNKERELWLINTTQDRDVGIGDLKITVRKGQRVNLLSKHYNLSQEDIDKSIKDGSIAKKKSLLAISEVKPKPIKANQVLEKVKPILLTPLRNPVIDTSPTYYEELEIKEEILTEEQFAAEHADEEFFDTAPALAVDKNLKQE